MSLGEWRQVDVLLDRCSSGESRYIYFRLVHTMNTFLFISFRCFLLFSQKLPKNVSCYALFVCYCLKSSLEMCHSMQYLFAIVSKAL